MRITMKYGILLLTINAIIFTYMINGFLKDITVTFKEVSLTIESYYENKKEMEWSKTISDICYKGGTRNGNTINCN